MILKMEKCFFHASFTPSFEGKVKIAQKRLIVASLDQFSWIPHVRAHQKWYCSNFFWDVFVFFIFYVVIRFFFGASSSYDHDLLYYIIFSIQGLNYEITRLITSLRELTDVKLALDAEIATYRRLLMAEDGRSVGTDA